MQSSSETGCQPIQVAGLPAEACQALTDLVEQTRETLQDDLTAILLYGSAAEGKLRSTSDINLLVVLSQFTPARIDPLRETLRSAHAIADIKVMFLLASELADAAEAFAMKFTDIAHRHLMLFGDDPMPALQISRDAKIKRVKDVLLNIAIRLRERYAMTSLREEQLALTLADITGPLRVAAATLLDIQGTPAASAKEALEAIAPTLEVADWRQTLDHLSTVRETRLLPPGTAAPTCFRVMEIVDGLRRLAGKV